MLAALRHEVVRARGHRHHVLAALDIHPPLSAVDVPHVDARGGALHRGDRRPRESLRGSGRGQITLLEVTGRPLCRLLDGGLRSATLHGAVPVAAQGCQVRNLKYGPESLHIHTFGTNDAIS